LRNGRAKMGSLRRFFGHLLAVAILGATLIAAPAASGLEGDADLWLYRFEGSGPPEYSYRAFNGQIVYYILEVTNRGPADATGVTVTQQLPAEHQFLPDESDPRCSASGSTVTCQLGTVPVMGMDRVLVYTRATSAGTFSSSASVSGAEADVRPEDNSATAVVTVAPAADVAVTAADSPDPVRSGGQVTYTVTVTNNGPDPATSGRLNANWQPFGPEATLESFSSTANLACFQSFFNHIDCDFATLASGETGVLTVVLSYKGKGDVEVRTYVIAAEFDPVANNEAVATTTVVRRRIHP
jgi:uncharacterized repeat protein (TIGR01451 family)